MAYFTTSFLEFLDRYQLDKQTYKLFAKEIMDAIYNITEGSQEMRDEVFTEMLTYIAKLTSGTQVEGGRHEKEKE